MKKGYLSTQFEEGEKVKMLQEERNDKMSNLVAFKGKSNYYNNYIVIWGERFGLIYVGLWVSLLCVMLINVGYFIKDLLMLFRTKNYKCFYGSDLTQTRPNIPSRFEIKDNEVTSAEKKGHKIKGNKGTYFSCTVL